MVKTTAVISKDIQTQKTTTQNVKNQRNLDNKSKFKSNNKFSKNAKNLTNKNDKLKSKNPNVKQARNKAFNKITKTNSKQKYR